MNTIVMFLVFVLMGDEMASSCNRQPLQYAVIAVLYFT